MRISLELVPTGGDRLEGRIVADDGRTDEAFSGTLDLLRVIEELQHAHSDAAGADSTRNAGSDSEGEGPSC